MQKLALFDLDGTLTDSGRGFVVWAQQAGSRYAAEHPAEFPAEFPAEARTARVADAIVAAAESTTVKLSGSISAVFAEAARATGDPALGPWLDSRFETEFPQLVECFPGVLDGLARLREAGWTIAVVTNGPTLRQRAKLVHSGLAELVDAWCISDEVGIAKPDRRIFERAAQACGVSLDGGGWMVGDSLRADIAGGAGVGLRTAWIVADEGGADIAREQLARGASVAPDHVLDTTVEAIGLMLAE
jgi:FMN phosphatase YigB (HAD superfamily)